MCKLVGQLMCEVGDLLTQKATHILICRALLDHLLLLLLFVHSVMEEDHLYHPDTFYKHQDTWAATKKGTTLSWKLIIPKKQNR